MTILLLQSGPGAAVAGGGGPVAGAEASAFLARTSGLDTTHTNAYINLINGLVADGVWATLDVLHVYATQNSTTALLNLVSSSFTGTANGSPAFTTDRGFTGVTGSTVYIDTGFNARVGTPHFINFSAHISAWSVTNVTTTNNPIIGVRDNSNTNTIIMPVNSGTNAYFLVNNDFGGHASNTDGSGHYIGSRTSSGSITGYRNGASLYSGSESGFTPVNANIYTLADNHSGVVEASAYQCAMASIGGALTSTDATNFYNRLRTYMSAVGVP